jgi:hypothetical protein
MNPKISGGLVHELPVDLTNALIEKDLVSVWETLTPIGRNEFICWIEDAKQEKTRIKRIGRTIEELQKGKKRPCCWAGCIHRTDKKPSKWQQDVLIDKKPNMSVTKPNDTCT